MMNRKYLLRFWGGVVVLFLVFYLQGVSYGAGIILKMDNSTLKDQNNSSITPNYTGPLSVSDPNTNIEFFLGAVPPDANSTSGRISSFNHTLIGSIHQYDEMDLGDPSKVGVYIRSWDGTPRQQYSHYGISGRYWSADGSSATARQYPVQTFKTDYLADKPANAPTITSVTEASERVEDTQDVVLSLTVGYSYNRGSSPDIIVATGYDIKYWFDPETEPDDSDTQRVVPDTGSPWALPGTDPKTGEDFGSGTYHFRVRAKNVFGAGPWSAVKDWPTLAGGIGETVTAIYDLKAAPEGGIGLNAVSILHTPSFNVDSDPVTSVSTIGELVTAINAKAVGSVVTAIGILENNQMQGVYITYDANGVPAYTPTTGFTGGADTELARLMQLQISVTQNVTVTFSQ